MSDPSVIFLCRRVAVKPLSQSMQIKMGAINESTGKAVGLWRANARECYSAIGVTCRVGRECQIRGTTRPGNAVAHGGVTGGCECRARGKRCSGRAAREGVTGGCKCRARSRTCSGRAARGSVACGWECRSDRGCRKRHAGGRVHDGPRQRGGAPRSPHRGRCLRHRPGGVASTGAAGLEHAASPELLPGMRQRARDHTVAAPEVRGARTLAGTVDRKSVV